MSTTEELLKTRARMKARKPHFTRQDQHKKNETKNTGWRRPRGIHSKMREGRRGYKRKISIGWKSPRLVSGLDRSGLAPVLIHRVHDLEGINPKTQGLVLASGVGSKKRIAILEAAGGKFKILNAPNPQAVITAIKERITKRKEQAAKRKQAKDQATKAAKAEPKKLEQTVSDAPATKEEEKKEHDKLLTQREV